MFGMLAGSALLIGAAIGLFGRLPQWLISLLMAFGAGALISATAFDLMEPAYRHCGLRLAALGVMAGALVFFLGDLAIARKGGAHRKRSKGLVRANAGMALALGALLDGVPESIAIGSGAGSTGSASWVIVAAVFASNLPEGLASAAGMRAAGYHRRYIMALWALLMVLCSAAAIGGAAISPLLAGSGVGIVEAFAAGAILGMLASTMMPEAYEQGGASVGLATALGFLGGFILDKI